MFLRSSFKSFGGTYIFIQLNSKAICFLLDFEIMLIPPVLFHSLYLRKLPPPQKMQDQVH